MPDDVAALNARAETALQQDQLIDKGGARDLFTAALKRDPGNETARRGLERVVERYLELAENAAAGRRFATARSMLARARQVDRDHPGIDPVENQVRLLSEAEYLSFAIDRQALKNRDTGLGQSLAVYGHQARAARCRSTIFSSRDADARWIYQQLSRSSGEARIRADFELGLPPRVETRCFLEQL